MEALRAAPIADGCSAQTVDEALAEVAGSVRENIQLRRAYRHAPAIHNGLRLSAGITRLGYIKCLNQIFQQRRQHQHVTHSSAG